MIDQVDRVAERTGRLAGPKIRTGVFRSDKGLKRVALEEELAIALPGQLARAPHINNIELGKCGLAYAGVNGFGDARSDLELHPTMKPVAMVADAIRDCSRRNDIVLDPFAGSGTTMMAAERTGRRGLGIELDPLYCDVILRRLHSVCGLEAALQATGQRFDEVASQRQEELRNK